MLIGFASTIPNEGSPNNSNDLLVESSSDTGIGNYLQGIVIGPESNRVAEARRFRVVWAGGITNRHCIYLRILAKYSGVSPTL